MADAATLKAERVLMEATGLTRSELRQNFQRDVQGLQTQLRKPENVLSPAVQLAPTTATRMVVTGHELPANSFSVTKPNDVKDGGGGDEGDPGTLLEDIIVVINGTAYYTNIYTDARLEEV